MLLPTQSLSATQFGSNRNLLLTMLPSVDDTLTSLGVMYNFESSWSLGTLGERSKLASSTTDVESLELEHDASIATVFDESYSIDRLKEPVYSPEGLRTEIGCCERISPSTRTVTSILEASAFPVFETEYVTIAEYSGRSVVELLNQASEET